MPPGPITATFSGSAAAASLNFAAFSHYVHGHVSGQVVSIFIIILAAAEAAIALAIVLAFIFGYSFTAVPLLRSGLALASVLPIALAADTFSITVMEIVDNAIILVIPGAMEAGLGDLLFWGSLAFALAVAWVAAFPVNRWLITKGRGHALVHAHH